MHFFFVQDFKGDECVLNAAESHHCVNVLRLNAGDFVHITDGKGNLYKTIIENANPKRCSLKILEINTEPPPLWQLHIIIAPTKSIARMEWLTEKLTEIGITSLRPVIAHHSERKAMKTERLQKIAVEAMKQSGRSFLPHIHEHCSFAEMLSGTKDFSGQKFIMHCIEKEKKTIHNTYRKGENAMLLIGPEGDFHNNEVEQAIGSGFIPITLGSVRYRTETAALVAACALHLLNE